MKKKFNINSYIPRLVFSFFIYLAAFFLYTAFGFFPAKLAACFMIVIPLFLLYFPGVSTKPDDRGEENWQPVTMKEVDNIILMSKNLKSVKIPFFYNPLIMIPFFIILIIFFIFLYFISGIKINLFYILLPLSAFVPFLFFGGIHKWVPVKLLKTVEVFKPVYQANIPDNFKLIPYIRFDRDKDGKSVPEDIKFVYEPVREIKGFNSVQFLLTWNRGRDREVPYLYGVMLFEDSTLRYKICDVHSDFICESADSENNGSFFPLVIRQNTSGNGYHTNKDDVHRLVSYVIMLLHTLSGT